MYPWWWFGSTRRFYLIFILSLICISNTYGCRIEVNGEQPFPVQQSQYFHYVYQAVWNEQLEFNTTFYMPMDDLWDDRTQTFDVVVDYPLVFDSYDNDVYRTCNISEFTSLCPVNYHIGSDIVGIQNWQNDEIKINIYVKSSASRKCYLDVIYRKERIDIELTGTWRDEGAYITLITNITSGYPRPISRSNLVCDGTEINSTVGNSGQEFRVLKQHYLGSIFEKCTIAASNRDQDKIIDFPGFSLPPESTTTSSTTTESTTVITTTKATTTAKTTSNTNIIDKSLLIGVSVPGASVIVVLIVVVVVMCVRRRQVPPTETHQLTPSQGDPANQVVVNVNGGNTYLQQGGDQGDISLSDVKYNEFGPRDGEQTDSLTDSQYGSDRSGQDMSADGVSHPQSASMTGPDLPAGPLNRNDGSNYIEKEIPTSHSPSYGNVKKAEQVTDNDDNNIPQRRYDNSDITDHEKHPMTDENLASTTSPEEDDDGDKFGELKT